MKLFITTNPTILKGFVVVSDTYIKRRQTMASVKLAWIKKFGEERGLQMWAERKKKSACTIERFIEKYGEEIGTIKYNQWLESKRQGGTLESFIKKYGEELGPVKYKEKNLKLSVSIESLKLNGKTDEEIEKIRQIHSSKSKTDLSAMIERHGEEIGTIKYNEKVRKNKQSSKRSIEYWINFHDGDLDLAQSSLSEYQRRDVKFYISKYGQIEGLERFNNAKQKRFVGGWYSTVSKFQNDVEEFIRNECIHDKIHDSKNPFSFFLTTEERSVLKQSLIIPDIVFSDLKIVVECNGNYWHCGTEYHDNFVHEVIGKTAFEIRLSDEQRCEIIKNRNFDIIVIWEKDWHQNNKQIKENLINEINKKRNIF